VIDSSVKLGDCALRIYPNDDYVRFDEEIEVWLVNKSNNILFLSGICSILNSNGVKKQVFQDLNASMYSNI
jgi:hypothetical protein